MAIERSRAAAGTGLAMTRGTNADRDLVRKAMEWVNELSIAHVNPREENVCLNQRFSLLMPGFRRVSSTFHACRREWAVPRVIAKS